MRGLFTELARESDAPHRVMATVLENGAASKTLIYGYDIKYCSGNKKFFQKNLDEIVSNYVKNWEIKTGRKADYSAIGLESVKVKNSLKLNIYRIIQELMTNIEKHSDATEVKINIIISWPSLLLKVSDNGGGFNLEQALEKSDGKSHSGLRGVMERVKISKGTIKIKFLQERGTVVNITFPLEDIDD